MSAWTELTRAEYDYIWDKFYLALDFHPDVDPDSWPSLREPIPSVTYSVSHYYGHPGGEALDEDLEQAALAAFQQLVRPGGWLYALDWKHPAYRFAPHAAEVGVPWEVPAFPNGDYYIFVPPDLSWGWFGHPWEETICIWGQPLLDALAVRPPRLFDRPVRRDGIAV
jgi:hypothetical protein